MNHARVFTPLLAVAALVTSSPSRAADLTKDQCIDANAKGQELLHDRKWTAAREQFHACASASCPKILRSDCASHLDDLDQSIPSIAFAARDSAGNDLSDVRITMDGAVIAEKLDGTALRLDPGSHLLVFSTAGALPVTRELMFTEHERRTETIVFGSASTPKPAVRVEETNRPALGEADQSAGMSSLRVAGIVVAGVGVVGLGVGVVFAALAGKASSDQQNACLSATNCVNYDQAASDHSQYQTDSAVSVTSLIAGGVLVLGGGAMILAGGRKAPDRPARTGVWFVPDIASGHVGLGVSGRFQ